jgi:hypothetical protein
MPLRLRRIFVDFSERSKKGTFVQLRLPKERARHRRRQDF